jgi:hypothetical protein
MTKKEKEERENNWKKQPKKQIIKQAKKQTTKKQTNKEESYQEIISLQRNRNTRIRILYYIE